MIKKTLTWEVQPPSQSRASLQDHSMLLWALYSVVLKTPKGWRVHSLSMQSAPLPDCPHGVEAFHYIQYEPLLPSAYASCPSTAHNPFSIFSITSPLVGRILLDPPVSFLSPETTSPAQVLLTLLLALHWTHSSLLMCFLLSENKKKTKGIVLTGPPQCGITSQHEGSADHHPLHMFNKTGPTADLITLVTVIQTGYEP